MFRKALLPTLALAVLSGCATDYSYRNGNGYGDYYYGRPQVEYRQIGGYGYGGFGYGAYGAYGGYGGYGYGNSGYYYDRFGRLVYGSPYSAYGSPYIGSYWRYRTRSQHGGRGDHDDDDNHDYDHDRDSHQGRPPWRNIGAIRPGSQEGWTQGRDGDGLGSSPAPLTQSAPRMERPIAPLMRSSGDGGGRVGGSRIRSGGGERARTRVTRPAED